MYPDPIGLNPERNNKGVMDSGIIVFAISTHLKWRFFSSANASSKSSHPIPKPRYFFCTKKLVSKTVFGAFFRHGAKIAQPVNSLE